MPPPHRDHRDLVTFIKPLDHGERHARLLPRSPLDLAGLRLYLVGIVRAPYRVQILEDLVEQKVDVLFLELSIIFGGDGYLVRDTPTVGVVEGLRQTSSKIETPRASMSKGSMEDGRNRKTAVLPNPDRLLVVLDLSNHPGRLIDLLVQRDVLVRILTAIDENLVAVLV